MTYEKDIPDFALVPAKEPEERILIPITQGAVYCPVQVTNITEKPKTVITLEEDVLVPDTRPDLREILLITGKVRLTNREIDPMAKNEDSVSLTGDVDLQTLYIPEKGGVHGPVISVSSRLPFREQWHLNLEQGASMLLEANVEKIDWMVVNERKYRVKVMLGVRALQYQDCKIQLFEGITEENLQTLRETVEITNVALRKKDVLSVREDLERKDGAAAPQNILMQHISVVENYKQAAGEKVVINGFVYVNLLYRSAESEAATESEGIQLCHLQDRVEFTQFIPLSQPGQWSGSNVCFDGSDLKVKLVQNEEGEDGFRLEGDLTTWVTLYRNVEKEIIVDGYHKEKNFVCDFEEASCRTLVGIAAGETTVREVFTLESHHGEAEEVVYVTGEILDSESRAENGKIITEGILCGKMICRSTAGNEMAAESAGDDTFFAVTRDLPFRCVTALPQLTGDETVTARIYLKDLWAEKISGKQLELNAAVMVCSEAMRQAPVPVLKNPAFEEVHQDRHSKPMAVYIVKPEDTLWSIAKHFQSTVDIICQINQIEEGTLRPGQKLLILR
ncbi:MAG: LysM peptidoglycan-binding domain-containing protein [Anaerovoracaceae bacterium]